MLSRLRRELIAITMLLTGLVLVGVLGTSLVSSYLTERAVTARILERALEGEVVEARFGDTGDRASDVMLAITVDVTSDGSIVGRDNTWLEIGTSTLSDVVREAIGAPVDSGESAAHPTISWMRASADWGWRIALVDTYSRDSALRTQALNALVILVVSMAALFVIAHVLSGRALRPVERAWSQQRRFVSDASHELKTPLAVILANAQILQADSDLPERDRRWVDSTLEEGGHLGVLIDDLLTLARSDERDGTGSRQAAEECDLTQLVSGCVLEFDAVAFERGCSITSGLEGNVCARVPADDYRRVVRTLLDNATKYADRGSVVRVTLERDAHRSLLAVNNQGEVISSEDLEHLFDRFYRTDGARQRSASGGFGLGLAIARSLVTAAGGKIYATSSEAEGTTFFVKL